MSSTGDRSVVVTLGTLSGMGEKVMPLVGGVAMFTAIQQQGGLGARIDPIARVLAAIEPWWLAPGPGRVAVLAHSSRSLPIALPSLD
mgnify:FL=1